MIRHIASIESEPTLEKVVEEEEEEEEESRKRTVEDYDRDPALDLLIESIKEDIETAQSGGPPEELDPSSGTDRATIKQERRI